MWNNQKQRRKIAIITSSWEKYDIYLTSDKGDKTDMDVRLDVIQESEEHETIKTTIEELETVILFTHRPDKKVYIRINLSLELKGKVIEFLYTISDCFAWPLRYDKNFTGGNDS